MLLDVDLGTFGNVFQYFRFESIVGITESSSPHQSIGFRSVPIQCFCDGIDTTPCGSFCLSGLSSPSIHLVVSESSCRSGLAVLRQPRLFQRQTPSLTPRARVADAVSRSPLPNSRELDQRLPFPTKAATRTSDVSNCSSVTPSRVPSCFIPLFVCERT